MKALREICTLKHFLIPSKRKFISNLFRTSFRSFPNPKFSRHLHYTKRCLRSQEPSFGIQNDSSSKGTGLGGWTIYGLVSDKTVTHGVTNGGGGQELEGETRGVGDSSEERTYRSDKRAKVERGSLNVRDFVGSKKKGKVKTSWVCSSCGHSEGQWWGECRSCHTIGSMKQFTETDYGEKSKVNGFKASDEIVRTWFPQEAGEVRPLRLSDVKRGISKQDWRIPLPGPFGSEVARVLGGGLVPGSLVLVGGDPGVGKSTLLLQMAAIIAEGRGLGKAAPVVYVSGEESVEQIGSRADRMEIGAEELFLYSSTDIEDILEKIRHLSPRALIIDSIQTVYLKGVTGSAGGIYQVKECTSALLRFAKRTNIPVLLIGHVTKSGDIAGPRVLEHIVDVVLYMEGEKYSSHRLLRPVKNRFGSTDELGVFEMSQLGMQAISNPSEMFISEQYSDSEVLAGLAVAVIMDGTRAFLIEIQALCLSGSTVSRQVNGIQASRADMIISIHRSVSKIEIIKFTNMRKKCAPFLSQNRVFYG